MVELLNLTNADGADTLNAEHVELEISTELSAFENQLFTKLVLEELPAFYDEVDSSFSQMILDSSERTSDPYGYFTLSKKIFVGRILGESAIFTVATYKRGGSVKIGPTIVVKDHRRQGIGRH